MQEPTTTAVSFIPSRIWWCPAASDEGFWQHADAHIRGVLRYVYYPCYSFCSRRPTPRGPEQTFRVPHPVLSISRG